MEIKAQNLKKYYFLKLPSKKVSDALFSLVKILVFYQNPDELIGTTRRENKGVDQHPLKSSLLYLWETLIPSMTQKTVTIMVTELGHFSKRNRVDRLPLIREQSGG